MSSQSRRWQTGVVWTFLALVHVWYWSRLFSAPGFLAHSDLYEQFLPVFLSPIRAWSSAEFAGLPLLADPQNTTWYPPHLLFARAINSWSGYVVSAYVIAALGAGAYAWQLTRSKVAALVAGLAWPWSEALADMFPHLAMLHGFAWLPWVLFGIEKVGETRSRFWIGATAFWFMCLGLSGHPQVSIYCAYVALGYMVTMWWASGRQRELLLAFGGMLLLGVGLSAVQVVPTLEVSTWIARDQVGFGQFADSFAKKPYELMTVIIPQFCHERREAPSYVGLFTLWLGVVALTASGREWRVRYWAVIAVIGLLLGLGSLTPLARIAYELPLYDKFRVVARHLVLYSFAVVALATIGIAALRQGKLTLRRGLVVATATTAAAWGGLAWVASRPDLFMVPCDTSYGFNGIIPESLTPIRLQGLLALIAGLVVVASTVKSMRTVALAAIPVVLAFDLMNGHAERVGWRGFEPPTIIDASLLEPSVHAAAVRSELAPLHQRVLPIEGSARDPLVPGAFARLWNIPNLGGYNPLLPDRLTRMASIEASGAMRPRALLADEATLDLFAVRRLVIKQSELTPPPALPADAALDELPALDMVIGPSDCRPRGAMSISLTLPRTDIAGLVLVSELRCGDNVEERATVGTVTVGSGADTRAVTLRAAVAATAATDGSLNIRMGDDDDAEGERAAYFASFAAPVPADRVTIDTAAMSASLYIDRIALVTASGELLPLSLPTAALGDRWTEVRRYSTSRESDRGADQSPGGEDDYVLFDNAKARPRAWFVGNVIEVDDEQAIDTIRFSRTRDGAPFDVATTAFVPPGAGLAAGGGAGAVSLQSAEHGRFTMTVNATSPGLVIISELHYLGWSATVDGQPARVVRADYAVIGIEVPAGFHRVALEFRPRMVWVGAAISLVSFGVLAMFLISPLRRKPA